MSKSDHDIIFTNDRKMYFDKHEPILITDNRYLIMWVERYHKYYINTKKQIAYMDGDLKLGIVPFTTCGQRQYWDMTLEGTFKLLKHPQLCHCADSWCLWQLATKKEDIKFVKLYDDTLKELGGVVELVGPYNEAKFRKVIIEPIRTESIKPPTTTFKLW